MLSVKYAQRDDLNKICEYIFKMNNSSENYIGYCSTELPEIKSDAQDIFGEDNFIFILDNDNIAGLLALDMDEESSSVELWGPFISLDDWDGAAEVLLNAAIKVIPSSIKRVNIFCGYKNRNCIKFAEENSFKRTSDQIIMNYENKFKNFTIDNRILKISERYYSELEQIHEKNFHGAYYNGKQIIDKVGEDNTIFTLVEKNEAAGYIYLSYDNEFKEGKIEFLAVDDKFRRKGFGRKLLEAGLMWLKVKGSAKITLVARASNADAISLYNNIGFKIENEMLFFIKQS